MNFDTYLIKRFISRYKDNYRHITNLLVPLTQIRYQGKIKDIVSIWKEGMEGLKGVRPIPKRIQKDINDLTYSILKQIDYLQEVLDADYLHLFWDSVLNRCTQSQNTYAYRWALKQNRNPDDLTLEQYIKLLYVSNNIKPHSFSFWELSNDSMEFIHKLMVSDSLTQTLNATLSKLDKLKDPPIALRKTINNILNTLPYILLPTQLPDIPLKHLSLFPELHTQLTLYIQKQKILYTWFRGVHYYLMPHHPVNRKTELIRLLSAGAHVSEEVILQYARLSKKPVELLHVHHQITQFNQSLGTPVDAPPPDFQKLILDLAI